MATKKTDSKARLTSFFDSLKSAPESRKRMLSILVIILFIGLAYLLRGTFIVALVNNRPITRLAVISELEKQAGQQALDSLVTRSLVYQEASRKGVSVSKEEIDKQLSTVEEQLKEQGHTFEEALAAQGVTRAEVEEQARFQLTIEKIFKDQVKVTDKEVDTYITENADFFKEIESDDAKVTARDQLEGERLQQVFQEWLSKAQKSDSVKILHTY